MLEIKWVGKAQGSSYGLQINTTGHYPIPQEHTAHCYASTVLAPQRPQSTHIGHQRAKKDQLSQGKSDTEI